MNPSLPGLVKTFTKLKILVLGDAMLDTYLQGSTDRLCREAPVPVVTLFNQKYAPGGAANAAVNVSDLGGQATFLSVIGDDLEGRLLSQALQERGVNTDFLLTHPGRRTLAKNRIIAGSQMMLRFDQGTTEAIDPILEQVLIHRLTDLFPECDALIISDYNYGILTPRLIEAIASLQAQTPRLLAVDSKQLPAYNGLGVTVVKPNYHEAVKLLDLTSLESSAARAEQMAAYEQQILRLTGAQIAAVTLDTEGSLIFEQGSVPYRTYAEPQSHSRAAGAGDTFLSSFALALAAGAHTPEAAELAALAASIVVSQDGTTTCSADQLYDLISTLSKYLTDLPRLLPRLDFYRQQGQQVVFTNGCFDILHRGHITLLNQAKALGDILIVGLNTDESVRRLKGPGRPINRVEDRAQVLTALSCVDHIISFTEDNPIPLIEAICPDVYVKGGDYTRETLAEASVVEKLGGEAHFLPHLQNFSTTSIIQRIHQVYAWPAENPLALVESLGS